MRNRLTAFFLLLLILAACGKLTATSTPVAATSIPATAAQGDRGKGQVGDCGGLIVGWSDGLVVDVDAGLREAVRSK